MDRQGKPDSPSYVVLPPSVPLVDEAAARIIPEGADFSRNLVVFPGKRPAHFLRKAVAEKRGSGCIPPVIFSIEEFVDFLCDKAGPTPTRKLETIDAVAFLFEIHKSMERPLGGDQFLSLEAFFPLGLRVYRDLEELLIEGVPNKRLRTVEPLIETPLPPRAGGGLQSLSFFYDRFYQAISEAGYSSRSERYVRAASVLTREMLPYEQIVFAGFYAFTECEKRLFKELLSWENTCFLFHEGPGLEARLASLGIAYCPSRADGGAQGGGADRIHFYKSPDAHGQVFALSGVLKREMADLQSPRSALSTVLVLPAPETLFPVLYHSLPLAAAAGYNISLGYPFERTPAWGFLSSLMQLVASMEGSRLYIPDYLGFVLHPYTKNIYFNGRTETTRILFHTLEELLATDRTRCFISLDEIEGLTGLFTLAEERLSRTEEPTESAEIRQHLVAIHDELIRRMGAFDDVADFAVKMSLVLTFIYERSSARLHPFFHPFAESFLKELDLLRTSRVGSLSFAERNSYFHFFRKYVAHCLTPFEGTPLQGVQVLGFLETRALRFERVYLLDANEDVLPDTRKEETLLPFGVREILGLPTYIDRDMLSAYYFETLVKGSGEVHLFFIENERKEKSRFVERLLWERQKRDGAATARGYVKSVGYRLSLENKEPDRIPKTASMAAYLKERPYDATSLDVYLNCPVQFYYRYVLDLARKEKVSPDIERVDIGRLVHRVLFSYFEKRLGRTLTGRDIDVQEMGAIVTHLCEAAYGPGGLIGSAYLLRRQIVRRMEAFLVSYQRPVAERLPVTILGLEQRIEASAGGFRLKGVVDRIETRGGTTCIVDYKTSASPRRLTINFDDLDPDVRASWSEAVGSIQLPFYLFLYQAHKPVAIDDLDAFFLLLGKTHADERIEVRLFRNRERAAADYEKAREVIFRLIGEIADPEKPFDPQLRAKGSCSFCDYRYLCGMQRPGA
jgi:CRISPR/Cas system-associated exonuclease Cas4 (RecB family)